VSVYRIISAERASFPVSVMCEVLGVSRPGFHQWERRAPSDRALSDAWLTEKITDIHERARGVYGSRRVQAELRLGQGIQVSRRRIQRLMRAAGISGLVKVKKGRTTIRVPGVRVADDLVERQFQPAAPNVSMGRRHHLSAELGGLALPRRRPRRLLEDDRGVGRWPSTCAQSS
jgi:putative transposase